jgi:ABC-type lipopolysaccharide export system ATPase subunit
MWFSIIDLISQDEKYFSKFKKYWEMLIRGYVIQTGKIVQSGTSRELLNSDEAKKAYLGM